MGQMRRTNKRQPAVKAERLAQAAQGWTPEMKSGLKKALIFQLVKDGTFEKYQARIEVLKDFAARMKYNFYQPDTIEDFVIAL